MERPRLLVIVGPTAAGKSDLAIDVARALGSPVISADSQQVYRGMDIGTGKVSPSIRSEIPHYGIDVIDPDEDMTAARFAALADEVIEREEHAGAPVVVVGGTGLYVRALLLGLFEGPPADAAIREALSARAEGEGALALWKELEVVDPAMAQRIDRRDRRRLIRALEVYQLTGTPMSEHQARHDFRTRSPRYSYAAIGISPAAEVLGERIERRVDAMIEAGLVGEVAGLRAAGYQPPLRSQQAIGYLEIHRHIDGEISLDEAVRLIKRNSRRYARRQRSWFRHGPEYAQASWVAERSEVDPGNLKRYLGGP